MANGRKENYAGSDENIMLKNTLCDIKPHQTYAIIKYINIKIHVLHLSYEFKPLKRWNSK